MSACVDRVQTGVRMERRLVKVLKAVAEFYSVSLGELLEEIVAGTFAGRRPFSETAMARVADLARIYGLDLESLSSAHVEERG
jgi:predicted DNA-binding ribbon-helix-helix protein